MKNRYGQLSYTSDTSGSGGWQIKQVVGDLTEAETDLLVAGVRTVFHPVDPIPDYPSPRQLEAAPRRLAYRPCADDAGAYWHSAPAGADATGRPGNVFAHAVLDRTPGGPPPLRPIQRWRSPEWLRPYGSAAVAAAMLPADAPGDGKVVSKESVISFVLDTARWRVGTLLALLDAVAAALDGGAPVILGAESVDSAAQWIGSVSFLMSAGTASTLSFSTFERAGQSAAEFSTEHLLTAIPLIDLAAAPVGTVVIDETATLSLGELGGEPHRTSTGHPIEVTAWSVMAQEALLEPQTALRILDEIDGFAAQTRDNGLSVGWPLAMAIVANPEFAESHPEARDVIAAHNPEDLDPDSAAADLVRDIFASVVGETTAQAWSVVEQNLDGAVGDYAAKTYLCRALDDEAWLDRSGPIPAGNRTGGTRRTPADLQAAVGRALDRAVSAGDLQRLLKVADLLIRSGIDDERLGGALEDLAGKRLVDPQGGPALVAELTDPLAPETRVAVAASVLGGEASVSAPVLGWLAEGVRMPDAAELLSASRGDSTWTRAMVCGLRAQSDPAAGDSRFARLWGLASSASPHLDEVAAGEVWAPEELSAVGGAGLSADALLPTLAGAPDSGPLVQLCDDVITTAADHLAVAYAMVRRFDPMAWVQHGYVDSHLPAYTSQWDRGMAQLPGTRVHPDFAVRLIALAAVAAVAGLAEIPSAETLSADEAVITAAANDIVAMVEQHLVVAPAVLAASLLRAESGEQDHGRAPSAVDPVLAVAAESLTAAGYLTENDEETVVETMMQLTGNAGQGPARRQYRKAANRALADRGAARPNTSAQPYRGY